MSAPGRTGARLALFFFALCVVIGVHMPYWPLWLAGRGFNAAEVGTLLFVLAIGRTVAAPLIGLAADRAGAHRRFLVAVCLLLVPATALFAVVPGFATQLALHVVIGLLLAAIVPLTDHLTLLAERRGAADYARTRAWGSKGFIVGSLLCGALLSGAEAERVLPILFVAMLLQAAAAWTLPDLRETPGDGTPHPGARAAIRALAGNRVFVLGILASGLIQASHGVLYAFATLHWQALGHDATVIGALWTEGVIAEIVLFYLSTKWLAHVPPARLLAIGGAICLVRWPLLAHLEGVGALVAVQVLHAGTFGATHLGVMRLLREAVPREYSATAQTLHSALVGGVFLGSSLWIAGQAWTAMGSSAFLLMTLPAAAGLIVAWRLGRGVATDGAVSPPL